MFGTATTIPDRGALSGPLAGISFIAGIGAANALAEGSYPRPGAEPNQVSRYFTQNAGPTRPSAAGQGRLRGVLGPVHRVRGAAGRRQWPGGAGTGALSARWGRRADSAATLARRGFLAGGVIHTPAFGVLVGGLGLAGLRTGELPRPLALTALASASACLLSPLYLVAEPFAWFIPAGPFPGLIVAGVAGARLANGGHRDR
jgi:hypothetical protein